MRQRLGIAASLVRRPRLLLLDEPTTGLDPAGMRDMRALVARLAGDGITVLLSSHQLAEVEELCDRVAIIRSGRIVFDGPLGELLDRGGGRYRLETTDDERALTACRAQPGLRNVERLDGHVAFAGDAAAAAALSLRLGAAGIGISALVPQRETLEQLFLHLTEGGPAERDEVAVEDLEEVAS
jgi:ABC-2 type transport system ATP-binding protein